MSERITMLLRATRSKYHASIASEPSVTSESVNAQTWRSLDHKLTDILQRRTKKPLSPERTRQGAALEMVSPGVTMSAEDQFDQDASAQLHVHAQIHAPTERQPSKAPQSSARRASNASEVDATATAGPLTTARSRADSVTTLTTGRSRAGSVTSDHETSSQTYPMGSAVNACRRTPSLDAAARREKQEREERRDGRRASFGPLSGAGIKVPVPKPHSDGPRVDRSTETPERLASTTAEAAAPPQTNGEGAYQRPMSRPTSAQLRFGHASGVLLYSKEGLLRLPRPASASTKAGAPVSPQTSCEAAHQSALSRPTSALSRPTSALSRPTSAQAGFSHANKDCALRIPTRPASARQQRPPSIRSRRPVTARTRLEGSPRSMHCC